MKDEEKACIEKLLETAEIKLSDRQLNIICRSFELACEKSYEDGLEAGKPKLHNLKKNPDDLPPKHNEAITTSVNVYTDRGWIAFYDFEEEVWFDSMFYTKIKSPTMWCELPKLEDKTND